MIRANHRVEEGVDSQGAAISSAGGLVAIAGLLGVAVGGGLTVISSNLQDRRKRSHDLELSRVTSDREDQLRLEQRRFDAYVDFTRLRIAFYASCRSWKGVARNDDPELRVTYEAFLSALSPAFLVSRSVECRRVLANLASCVRELAETDPTDAADLLALLTRHRNAVKAAELVMREELGMG